MGQRVMQKITEAIDKLLIPRSLKDKFVNR